MLLGLLTDRNCSPTALPVQQLAGSRSPPPGTCEPALLCANLGVGLRRGRGNDILIEDALSRCLPKGGECGGSNPQAAAVTMCHVAIA